MGCLEGTIEETYFHIKDANPCDEGICPNLVKGRSATLEKGAVAYIRDEIALHVINPMDGNGVSLHLYSPPIKTCSIYIPALGKVCKKQLGYFSKNKVRCTDD